MGLNVYIFSPGHLAVFNVIIRVTFLSFAMQDRLRLSVFGCVLKPLAAEGAFQNRKFGLFSFKRLVDKHSLDTKPLRY